MKEDVNKAPSSTIDLLQSPWDRTFYDLVDRAQSELLIVSPFISSQPIEKIAGIIDKKSGLTSVEVFFVTNLSVDNLLSGTLDIAALLEFVEHVHSTRVVYLPSLHAKVYIADTKVAVITSANLTYGGLRGNHEYGILVHDSQYVAQVRSDLMNYASLGNEVSLDTMQALAQATRELKSTRRDAEKSIGSRLKAIFNERVEHTKLELLKARARGKTTHGIFSETILYLLEIHGPLATTELHPLIQQIHPDICDDTIDRVIDDVNFGKKWKHNVRNAQLGLKRQELIDHDGVRWYKVK